MPSRPFLPLRRQPRMPLLVILLLALGPPAMLLSWGTLQFTAIEWLAALLFGTLSYTLLLLVALGCLRQQKVLYGKSITFHGRRYRRGIRDIEATGRLERIVTTRRASADDGAPPPRLVEFRGEFRALASCRPIGGLVECLKSGDRELQALALWVLGRCGRNGGLSAVAVFRRHEDASIRREAARALRRLGGWPALESMALHDPDARVRRLATCPPPSDFTERLARFTRTARKAPTRVAERPRMALFARIPLGPGQPAKSREFIRRILEHIRYLVRGIRSNGPSENSI